MEPGASYGVQVTWPPHVQHLQQLGTTPVSFSVRDCSEFSLQTRVHEDWQNTGEWTYKPQDFRSDERGGYIADVNVAEIARSYGSSSCWSVTSSPTVNDLQLVVTCAGDGRVATSNTVPLTHAIAFHTSSVGQNMRQLFSIDAHRQIVVGTGGIYYLVDYQETRSKLLGMLAEDHAFVRSGDVGYLSATCAAARCGTMEVQDPVSGVKLGASESELYILDLSDFGTDSDSPMVTGMVSVPGTVLRLFVDSDESLVVASAALVNNSVQESSVVLSRVRDGRVTTERVLDHQFFDVFDEWNANTAMARSPWFLTFAPDESNGAFRPDSLVLWNMARPQHGQRLPTPGVGGGRFASIAPEGNQWITRQDDGAYLGSLVGEPRLLPISTDFTVWSAAWTPQTVALGAWIPSEDPNHRGPTVFFISRTDGTLRATAPIAEGGLADLFTGTQVYAVGNGLIAQHSANSLRLYDKDGILRGGTAWAAGCVNGTTKGPVGTYGGDVAMWLDDELLVLDRASTGAESL